MNIADLRRIIESQVDYNSNYKPKRIKTTTSRITAEVPNVLTKPIFEQLQDAAKKQNRSLRRKTPTPSLPPGFPLPNAMAERRREKFHLKSDVMASNGVVYYTDDSRRTDPRSHGTADPMSGLEDSLRNLQLQPKTPDTKSLDGKKTPIPESGNWKVPSQETWAILQNLKMHQLSKPGHNQCCCNRPKRVVWCYMCGFNVKGNVKTVCPMHPNNIFLYEWEVCGNQKCKAPNYLTEIDLD